MCSFFKLIADVHVTQAIPFRRISHPIVTVGTAMLRKRRSWPQRADVIKELDELVATVMAETKSQTTTA